MRDPASESTRNANIHHPKTKILDMCQLLHFRQMNVLGPGTDSAHQSMIVSRNVDDTASKQLLKVYVSMSSSHGVKEFARLTRSLIHHSSAFIEEEDCAAWSRPGHVGCTAEPKSSQGQRLKAVAGLTYTPSPAI